jgi:hypothetical protein
MSRQLKNLLVALFFGIGLSEADAQSLPQDCFSLSRKIDARNLVKTELAVVRELRGTLAELSFPPNYNFLKEIAKKDVVCVGANIAFDQPLYTNGGDLFVYAQKITIRAPIDTRIYFNAKAFVWNEGDVKEGNKIVRLDQRKVTIVDDPKYLASYNDYYTACLDCKRENNEILIPRLPDGLVPADGTGSNSVYKPRRTGEPAFSRIDRFALRPGSVWLFAAEIDVVESLKQDWQAPTCPAAFPDKQRQGAIDARGLYGGRGGAGSPVSCIVSAHPKGGGRCPDGAYTNAGLTGVPGKGGDGGFVFVGLIGTHPEKQLDVLDKSIDVSGGAAVTSDAYWSTLPQGAWGNAATGNICDFFQRKKEGREPAQNGDPGRKKVQAISPEDALHRFLGLVAAHDATPGYSFPVMDDKQQLSSHFADGLLFSDKVNAELIALMTRAQLNLLTEMQSIFYVGNETGNGALLPEAFHFSHPAIKDLTDLHSATAVLLTELSKYDQIAGRNVESFFGATGGMFNIATPNTYQQYILSLFRLDLAVQKCATF